MSDKVGRITFSPYRSNVENEKLQKQLAEYKEVVNRLGWRPHNNDTINATDWMEIVPGSLAKLKEME